MVGYNRPGHAVNSTRATSALRRITLGLVLLLVVALPGAPPAPSLPTSPSPGPSPSPSLPTSLPTSPSLSGRLVGPDGAGLPGHVAAWREADPTGARVEVDCAADGTFSLPGASDERWVVAASAPGFSEARAVRSLPLSAPLELRVVVAARVAGQVLGVDGTAAVADVLIVGSGIWPARTTRSDAGGRFAFDSVPPGVYEVEARGALASAEPRRGLVVEEGARVVLTLALAPGRTLGGTVVDDATGEPIANAEIVVAESSLSSTPRIVRSDATGAFHVEGLRAGVDAIVTARAEGRVSLVGETWRGSDLTLRLRRTGAIEGRVLDQDRQPIAGAQIEVWGETEDGQPIAVSEAPSRSPDPSADPGRLEVTADVPPIPIAALASSASLPAELPSAVHLASYRTGLDGTFHVEGVAPGQVEVLARQAGFATGASERLRVSGGETTGGIEVVLAPAGTLRGVVVDERGDAVADVRIEARSERDPWPTIAFTDAQGAFSIAATGETLVRALPVDRAPAEVRATVASGATRETRLTLDPAGLRLSGRVVDARGFPVENAQLRVEALRPGTPILRTAFSAEDGTFELASVPAPPLRVTVDQGDFAMGTSVDVTSLDEVEIEVQPSVRAVGVVTDTWSGEPLAGAQILLVSDALPPLTRETTTGAEGRFALPRLRPGAYAMRVEAGGYVTVEESVLVRLARGGEVELDPVALDPGQRVEGDVVDRLGSVLEGASIRVDGLPAVMTDAHGHFALTAVPAGDVVLHVTHPSAGALDLARRVARGRDDVAVIAHLPGRADAAPVAPSGARVRAVAISLDELGAVTAVARGSSAERAGVRIGDVLVSVDGHEGPAGLIGAGPALLVLTRGGERFVVRAERERR